MKKTLSILLLSAAIIIGTTQVQAAETQENGTKNPIEKQQIKQKFEKRLNLTEKQKEKAKKIHEKGAQQMKPIMKKMGELRKEIAEIKKSELEETAKQEQIDKKFEEIRKLDQKAREIRKQNSKDFEKILTKEQKEELAKMKAEGRRKFEKNHPPRPPFNMFGPERGGGEKGIFPPPPPPKFEK